MCVETLKLSALVQAALGRTVKPRYVGIVASVIRYGEKRTRGSNGAGGVVTVFGGDSGNSSGGSGGSGGG